MSQFEIDIRVIYHESVTVEADTLEEARAIVEGPDFSVNDTEDWAHSAEPDIELDDE